MDPKRPYEWLYNRLKRAAKERAKSLIVELTFEEFLEFTKTTLCHYCDSLIEWSAYSSLAGKQISHAYNLDRKDTNKNYTKDNCVVCCVSCNKTKGDRFTYEQFKQIGEVIKTFAR